MKNNKKRIIIICVISIIIIIIALSPTIKNEIAYREAKNALRSGDYNTAQQKFYDLDEYRESEEFYHYVKAKGFYEIDAFSTASAHLDRAKIKDSEFKSEVEDFKIKFEKAYDNYINEKGKERIAEQEKEEKEIKNKIPYVGMSTKYLNQTKLGNYGDYFTNRKVKNGKQVEYKVYSWYSESGKLIMRASVEYSTITGVNKFNESTCWNGDDLKDGVLPNGTQKAKSYKKQTATTIVDEYDVNDYSNEEDFYYDHYDDFYDYYDAEDYYREHHE